jgi:hypothetical protein
VEVRATLEQAEELLQYPSELVAQDVRGIILPGAIIRGRHPGAMLGARAALEHGLEYGLARPRLPHILPRGDESAMNRLGVWKSRNAS